MDANQDEAARLAALYHDNPAGLLAVLSAQLTVLKTQAQMFMGLAAITITVTGFSGHNMVRGGAASTAAMVVGIVLVLLGIWLTIGTIGNLRWVTQDLSDDLVETARVILRRRDKEQRMLRHASRAVALGVSAYLVAVVLAAVTAGERFGPP